MHSCLSRSSFYLNNFNQNPRLPPRTPPLNIDLFFFAITETQKTRCQFNSHYQEHTHKQNMSSSSSKSSAASRYSSYKSSQSSTTTNTPSSSSEFKSQAARPHSSNPNTHKDSGALVKAKVKNEQTFSSMVKKLMEKKSTHSSKDKIMPLIVPVDFIAEDLKKTAKNKGSNFTALPRKLFGKGSGSNEKKALTEVKANTRTLAMVLRSERELLSLNKDQEVEISQLKSLLEERNKEVDKLKDLCLKQREEIKALKSAILFPEEMNCQLQELLAKQGTELKQAKQVIPTLQRQITSLTGQLQILTEDIAEVKADKYSLRSHFEGSPGTLTFDQEEAVNSLDFGSGDPTSPGSPPDDMLLKDINPCLTPYYAKTKSKEFRVVGYESPEGDQCQEMHKQIVQQNVGFGSEGKKLSRSSDYCRNAKSGSNSARVVRRSDGNKCTYGRKMTQQFM